MIKDDKPTVDRFIIDTEKRTCFAWVRVMQLAKRGDNKSSFDGALSYAKSAALSVGTDYKIVVDDNLLVAYSYQDIGEIIPDAVWTILELRTSNIPAVRENVEELVGNIVNVIEKEYSKIVKKSWNKEQS